MVIPNGNRSDVSLGSDPYVHLRRGPEGVIVEGEPSWESAGPTGNWSRGEAPSAGWKVSGEQITIECDRLGVHPLFIWSDRTRIAVSPSIPRLLRLGAPRDMDFAAFAAFLRMGFFLGNDTPFAAIRAVPGGTHHLEVGSEFMAREDRLPGAEPSLLSRDAAIDRYIELFRAAIESGIADAGRIVLPLSGGRDSRHILLELLEQGRPPDLCVTATYYPPRPDVDREVARNLAERVGVPHRTLAQAPSQLATLRRHICETGFCTLTPSSFIQPISDFCRAQDIDCVLDGLAGDTLSSGHFLSRETDALFAQGRFHELAEILLGTFNGLEEDLIRGMVAPDLLERLDRDLAIARVVRELERHTGASNPVTSFVFFNRTRRDIALMPTRVYRAIPRVVCPFLFSELFDFLFSLPAAMVVDHAFHEEAMHRAYPAAASIPYAGLAADKIDRRQQLGFALEVARHLAGRRRSRLISKSFAWPRVLRCLVDPRYLRSISWFGPGLVYLAELGADDAAALPC